MSKFVSMAHESSIIQNTSFETIKHLSNKNQTKIKPDIYNLVDAIKTYEPRTHQSRPQSFSQIEKSIMKHGDHVRPINNKH